MSTGLLLVTHAGIASALLTQARSILDDPMHGVGCFEVGLAGDGEAAGLSRAFAEVDQGDGVLMLTDLPGATPANLALGLCAADCRLVSGLNLPMLIRAWNYRDRPPRDLARLAIEGGRNATVELA